MCLYASLYIIDNGFRKVVVFYQLYSYYLEAFQILKEKY